MLDKMCRLLLYKEESSSASTRVGAWKSHVVRVEGASSDLRMHACKQLCQHAVAQESCRAHIDTSLIIGITPLKTLVLLMSRHGLDPRVSRRGPEAT